MIHDLYSEDMNNEDYSSPDKPEELQNNKLNPVIEESNEYSITPSCIVQTGRKSPERNTRMPKICVIDASATKNDKDETFKIDLNLGNNNGFGKTISSVTPKAFNQNEFFQQAQNISQ